MNESRSVVVALGGNAITREGVTDTIANQFRHTRESLDSILFLAKQGWKLAITHGNGPQVGNALLRVELARGRAPELPVGICVADTQGGMGYMIEQSLQNALAHSGIRREVVTVVTQVCVDPDDPAISKPSKFIGQAYDKSEAEQLAKANDWQVRKDGNRGWRRVVASPKPLSIVESQIVRRLVADGTIVVCCGGGGIPVYRRSDNRLEGIDAVIDKDRVSALLASEIDADLLLILTAVDRVYLNFDSTDPEPLSTLNIIDAERYLNEGQFPRGSMRPKIEAALSFLKQGGREVIISSIQNALDAVQGNAGTRIAA